MKIPINAERFDLLTNVENIKNGYIIITKEEKKRYFLVVGKHVVELVSNNGKIWHTKLDEFLKNNEILAITNKKGELLVHDKITGEDVK